MAKNAQNPPFKGRITYQHHAHTEFTGKPPVLIPDSSDDVAAALAVATAGGRTIYIRRTKVPLTAAMLNVAFEPWGYNRRVKGGTKWTGVAAQVTWQYIGIGGSFYSAALYGSMA